MIYLITFYLNFKPYLLSSVGHSLTITTTEMINFRYLHYKLWWLHKYINIIIYNNKKSHVHYLAFETYLTLIQNCWAKNDQLKSVITNKLWVWITKTYLPTAIVKNFCIWMSDSICFWQSQTWQNIMMHKTIPTS